MTSCWRRCKRMSGAAAVPNEANWPRDLVGLSAQITLDAVKQAKVAFFQGISGSWSSQSAFLVAAISLNGALAHGHSSESETKVLTSPRSPVGYCML